MSDLVTAKRLTKCFKPSLNCNLTGHGLRSQLLPLVTCMGDERTTFGLALGLCSLILAWACLKCFTYRGSLASHVFGEYGECFVNR